MYGSGGRGLRMWRGSVAVSGVAYAAVEWGGDVGGSGWRGVSVVHVVVVKG